MTGTKLNTMTMKSKIRKRKTIKIGKNFGIWFPLQNGINSGFRTLTAGTFHAKSINTLSRQVRNPRCEGETHFQMFNDQKGGRPSIVTGELVKRIENAVDDDCRLTLDKLSATFLEISRSILDETVTHPWISETIREMNR